MWVDRLGSAASAACAVHCLVLSAAPALLSLLGLNILTGQAIEWGFFAMAIGFAAVAGGLGYRTHRSAWVLVGFGAGTLVLTAGRFGEAVGFHQGGVYLAIGGGILLVASHLASLWQTRICHQDCCA
jgi:hypothetical protein